MIMDSPWDEEAAPDTFRDAEWAKMSSEFETTGYREGITAGKEFALQEGFDSGFAQVGAPIGREIGMLRGMISALLASLTGAGSSMPSQLAEEDPLLVEARSIASQLSKVRFSEIAPRDLEAEAHAREHLELDAEDDNMEEENEEIAEKRKMERLEDMLAQMSAGSNSASTEQPRLTMEDVHALKTRTQTLFQALGLNVNRS